MLLARQLVSATRVQARSDLGRARLPRLHRSARQARRSCARAEQQQQTIISITRRRRPRPTPPPRGWPKLEATDKRDRGDDRAARPSAGRDERAPALQAGGAAAGAGRPARPRSRPARARAQQLQAAIARDRGRAGRGRARARPAQARRRLEQCRQLGVGRPDPVGPLGPSGGWAIPYAIVLCESGGQNLPPEQRRRVGLLPDHARAPGSCSAAPGRRPTWPARPSRTRWQPRIWNGGRRRVQLGLRRDRRNPLSGSDPRSPLTLPACPAP